MQLAESSIFVNLKRLRRRLYSAQFCMQKAERVIYGTPLMSACGKAIASFVLAWTVSSRRMEYIEECMGHFAVLRADLEFCVEENIIKFRHRKPPKDKDGKVIPFADVRDAVSTQKVELFCLVARIDEDMCKWRASLAKGKTMHAE